MEVSVDDIHEKIEHLLKQEDCACSGMKSLNCGIKCSNCGREL